ncbi:hypothetical protein V6N13_024308 [Hibiscus sabdariffa]
MADVLEPEVGWWSAAGAGMAATRDLDKNRDYNEEEENVEEFEVSDTEYGFDDGLQQENIGIGIRVQRQMDGFGPEGVRVNLELESDSDKSDELLSDHDSNSNGLRYSEFNAETDMGLVDAVDDSFPNANVRNCVRHIYNNFKEVHKGKALKDAVWKATRATYLREFEDALEQLKAISGSAYDWMQKLNPAQRSKSHFDTRTKCDILLNNLSRDKPILTMMEDIRTKIMKKNISKREEAEKWPGPLCDKIKKKILDIVIQQAHRCWTTRAGGERYQVHAGLGHQHVVDLVQHTCSCRKWDIIGIPCVHAISVIQKTNRSIESYVNECYHKSTQIAIYSNIISPMKCPEQWTPVSDIEPILPPTIRRPSGRPSKKRKREADEVSNPKLTKRGQQANCTKCGKPSHNKRTCRGEIGVNQPIKRPTPSNQPQPPRHPGSHPSSSNQQQPMTPPTIVRLMPNQPSGQQSIVSNPPTQESQASTRD